MAQKLFDSQSKAAKELQAQICTAVGRIDFPAGLGVTNAQITEAVRQNIDAVAFDKHNQSGIVEVHANFTATNSNGTRVFQLEAIWDADTPPVGSTQTAHFGWEVYLDGRRVAGPGHVFFEPNVILSHYRNNKREQTEVFSLQLNKSGGIGSGTMQSKTQYYRLR